MSASNISAARIQALPPLVIDRIAAGEVVDGPYSVVKELVENSLDAGASNISVETRGGGMELVAIGDDGAGIEAEDLPLSLERHATSKIERLEDIESVLSFGFRGEALASIASVSHLELSSTRTGAQQGARIESRGGRILNQQPDQPLRGTRIRVSELFYAVPARRKFVRSERGENARIQKEVLKAAFARTDVGFVYRRDDKELLRLPAEQDLRERIGQVYRGRLGERLIALSADWSGFRLTGFVGDEHCYRTNREGQFTYVNGRCVELPFLSALFRKAFGELLPPGAHPYVFLFIELDPAQVDVNVHPAKKEVRLRDQQALNSLVLRTMAEALRPGEPVSFQRYRPSSLASPEGREPISLVAAGLPGTDAKGSDARELDQAKLFLGRTIGQGSAFEMRSGAAGSPDEGTGLPAADTPAAIDAASGARVSFVPVRHFGVIFGTYILAEGEDAFYLIDQHTAHERVNYERMRSQLEALQSSRQGLLHPVVIECLADEHDRVLAEAQRLLECGFAIEDFGECAYVVREVPAYVDPGTEADALSHVIQRLADGESVVRVYDELAAMKACKASIKKNDHVSGDTISAILLQLAQCENPARCPHGRPTMMKLTRAELDRMFHRS